MKELIGVYGVDAGLVMVGDPCYFWPEEPGGQTTATESIQTWGEVCKKLRVGLTKNNGMQLMYKMGHPGLGVIGQTTSGDGEYRVFLETTSTGKRRLIVEL